MMTNRMVELNTLIDGLAAQAQGTGLRAETPDREFLKRFASLAVAYDYNERCVPEQTLNFADGSKLVIRNFPLIDNATWSPKP